MAINLYVRQTQLESGDMIPFDDAYAAWNESSEELKGSMKALFETLGDS